MREAIDDLRNTTASVAAEFKRLADVVAEDCANAIGDGFREGPNAPLFEEIETAVAEPSIAELQAIDALTPRVVEIMGPGR